MRRRFIGGKRGKKKAEQVRKNRRRAKGRKSEGKR